MGGEKRTGVLKEKIFRRLDEYEQGRTFGTIVRECWRNIANLLLNAEIQVEKS
jgi:hypothetical protein